MSITSDKRGRPVTAGEAMEAAHALIDHFFRNNTDRRVKAHIPAEVDDTDIILCDYIRQTQDAGKMLGVGREPKAEGVEHGKS